MTVTLTLNPNRYPDPDPDPDPNLRGLGLQRHSPSQALPIEAEGGYSADAAPERYFGPVRGGLFSGRDGLAARDPAHDLCGRPARRYREP